MLSRHQQLLLIIRPQGCHLCCLQELGRGARGLRQRHLGGRQPQPRDPSPAMGRRAALYLRRPFNKLYVRTFKCTTTAASEHTQAEL